MQHHVRRTGTTVTTSPASLCTCVNTSGRRLGTLSMSTLMRLAALHFCLLTTGRTSRHVVKRHMGSTHVDSSEHTMRDHDTAYTLLVGILHRTTPTIHRHPTSPLRVRSMRSCRRSFPRAFPGRRLWNASTEPHSTSNSPALLTAARWSTCRDRFIAAQCTAAL